MSTGDFCHRHAARRRGDTGPVVPTERDHAMSDISNDLPTRVGVLEEIARGIKAALDRIDRRFDNLERRMDTLAAEHRADFRWLLGVMIAGFAATIGGFAGLLAVMAHGFHWL
jgi:hypothetical protein